jgi:hypothetical protein
MEARSSQLAARPHVVTNHEAILVSSSLKFQPRPPPPLPPAPPPRSPTARPTIPFFVGTLCVFSHVLQELERGVTCGRACSPHSDQPRQQFTTTSDQTFTAVHSAQRSQKPASTRTKVHHDRFSAVTSVNGNPRLRSPQRPPDRQLRKLSLQPFRDDRRAPTPLRAHETILHAK